MPQFTVRVELYAAQRVDYNTLHAAMAQRGFSRLITSDEGRTYELPWAEYDRSGNLTAVQVLGMGLNAAASTGKGNSVFVTEAKSRAWSGLPSARSDSDVVPCFEERQSPKGEQDFPVDDWV
jgi:hypothetical protein